MPDRPPPLPARRLPDPRRLWRELLRHPRAWTPLVAWPGIVLAFVLLRHLFAPSAGLVVGALEAVLLLSALLCLGLYLWLAGRLARELREVRQLLFEGHYESALEMVRHRPALAEGLGLEGVLVRLLAFDRRRAEKLAANARLLDRLLRETPAPILIGHLDDDLVRFSRSLCRLLDITDDRFPLDSLLLAEANRHFAYVWDQLATGRKTSLDATVTLQLPVAHKSRQLHLRLLAVQDDQGRLATILGFARPAEEQGEAPAPAAEQPPAEAPEPPRRDDANP